MAALCLSKTTSFFSSVLSRLPWQWQNRNRNSPSPNEVCQSASLFLGHYHPPQNKPKLSLSLTLSATRTTHSKFREIMRQHTRKTNAPPPLPKPATIYMLSAAVASLSPSGERGPIKRKEGKLHCFHVKIRWRQLLKAYPCDSL